MAIMKATIGQTTSSSPPPPSPGVLLPVDAAARDAPVLDHAPFPLRPGESTDVLVAAAIDAPRGWLLATVWFSQQNSSGDQWVCPLLGLQRCGHLSMYI